MRRRVLTSHVERSWALLTVFVAERVSPSVPGSASRTRVSLARVVDRLLSGGESSRLKLGVPRVGGGRVWVTVERCLQGVGVLGLHLVLIWVKGLDVGVGQTRGCCTALLALSMARWDLCFLVAGGAQVECNLHTCHCMLQLHSHVAAEVERWQPVQPI